MINYCRHFTVDMLAHVVSIGVLAFSLIRLFRHIDKHNKAIWKMKDRINELGSYRDEDLNAITRLEQKVSKINSCKGCAPKKKAIK